MSTRHKTVDYNTPVFVGDVFTVGAADRSAGGVGHKERDAGEGFGCTIFILLNDNILLRCVGKGDGLRVVRAHSDGLRFAVKDT